MNNANFGFDYRNNTNNTKFEPIVDEIGEMTYIKKYYDLFDSQVANFVKSDVLEQNINKEYEQKMAMIKENDPFKDARIAEIENEKKTNTDALSCHKTKEKKSKTRKIKSANL